ncbi:hypothetical protein BSKO_12538 [Bryopsis sp. KO-2023]|nr:hypothetical protein BSKO_12538 [Bryopsis sp. KO-2023]
MAKKPDVNVALYESTGSEVEWLFLGASSLRPSTRKTKHLGWRLCCLKKCEKMERPPLSLERTIVARPNCHRTQTKMKRQRQPPAHPAAAIGTLAAFLLLTSGFCSARVLQQNVSATAEGEGFLSNELPLEILVTTPSELADNSTRRLRVEDQQALTVVFSRSVIALGQDFGVTSLPADKVPFFLEPEIPGRFRWVTTYIARWDPDESWPLDSEVKFTLNENLKTHDGILFRSDGEAGSVILTTPSLSMDIESVQSEKAPNLTDDDWGASIGLESDILPEVPPDGVIRLTFNTKVSLTALQEHLKVLNDSSEEPVEGLGVNVQPCDPESDTIISPKPCLRCKVSMESEKSDEESDCAEVSIHGDVQMETRYALSLFKGVEYSKKDGALKAEKKVTFGGLRRFRIPFFNTTDGGPYVIGTNFLRMQLPHGLEKNTKSDIQALKKQLMVMNEAGEEVDFELELENNSTLRISTSFTPETVYTISVNGSSKILDGFGLPLESSSIKILTEKVGGVFEPFRMENSYAIFEAGEDWGQKVVAAFKGDPDISCPLIEANTLSLFPISGSKNIETISNLFASVYRSNPNPLRNDIKHPIGKLQQETKGSTKLVEFDLKKYLNSSGLVAAEFCRDDSISQMLINESDMQALILGSENGQSIVWVTSMKTGKPVRGAKVTILQKIYDEEVKSVAANVTDVEGRAFFFDGLLSADFAHVEYKKKSFFVRRVYSGYDDLLEEISASLVLDRRLVKPGDTLYIKGYSRGPGLTESAEISLYPAFDAETSEYPIFPIDFDEKFGTFELKIPIPENATNTEYNIALNQDHDLETERFTVGNPRPPTVGLTVDAPFWAKPNSKVMVNITAESFIGAVVGDTKITLTWSIPDEGEPLEGEVELITDSSGKVSTEIDLGSLEKTPPSDESLKIKVSWVGPTRELLEESASVLLRNADVDIDFDRTVETDFPGQEFGVKVSMTDLKGEPIESRTLVVALKQIPPPEKIDVLFKNSQPVDGDLVDSCKIQSNSKGFDCRFSIPDLGYFVLETCIEIETNSKDNVCRILGMGKSAEMWKEDGLVEDHLPIGLVSLTEGPHKVGDRLTFGIENPYQNVKALVMWGSRSGINHKIMPINDSSLHEFSIDVGDNCERGCRLSVGVMVPRQTEGTALNPKGVPVSKLFDLAMPHSTDLSSNIEVLTDLPLDVEITFPDVEEDASKDFVISPGESTAIQVNITDSEIDEAEVTVIAVDRAILELLPYPLKDLTDLLEFTDFFPIGFSSSGVDLVSPRAIETLIQDFIRKREIDLWFEPVSQLYPEYHSSIVDKTEEEYVNSRSKFVTVNGGDSVVDELDYDYDYVYDYDYETDARASIGVVRSRSGFDEYMKQKEAGGGGALSKEEAAAIPDAAPTPSGSVRVLEDFVSTALFETVIAKGGIATVNFTAPDNLGTFNIRAYVATATEKYGSVERELIVRRVVSLTPSAPRFARVGDEFEAGAVVTVSGTNPSRTNVSVAIDLLEGAFLEIVGKSKRIVKLGEDGTEEVRFRFKAKQMGDAKFKITAEIVSQGASDALVINFPVEGLQEAVTVATSFAIDGNSSSQWQEGLQLPQAVPGSGAIAIQAGVGRLPAVLSMADQLYESNPNHKCPIDATFALALVAVPFITETYKVLDLDPASLDENSLEVISGIQSNFTSALESLQEMTRDEIGLDYFLNCKKYPRTFPTQPSLTMNARGVFLLGLLKEDLDTLEREVVKNGIPPLESLNGEWTSALETALLDEAESSRRNNLRNDQPIRLHSVALARAALGGDWVPPPETSKQIVEDLSMDRLSQEFDSMDVESQTFYILTRISMDGGENHPDIQKAINSWTSNFRVTGRTAYVAQSEGSSTPASNIANSLALMVMLKAKVENPLLEKLANYVGSPPVSQYGFRLFSSFDKAVAMVSLRNYDVDRGSNQPDLKLEVRSGETNLLDVQFSGNANPVASSSTPWEALTSPPEPLEFRADGIGEVTLAAALTFVPAEILRFPTYRGIFVQRSISIADSEDGNNMSLKTIPVTSVVEVSVQFTTPDRLGPTTVRVLMPAGLEPVDPNIDGSGGTCPVPFDNFFGGRSFFSFTCPDQETEPSVVTFRYNSVNAGTQTVNFRAVAATAGTFTLPPVKAFVNEQPEVMGLSPGGELKICSGASCVAVEDAPPKTPKSCPNDCSDNGACDLDSGVCLCLDGFIREDCGELDIV